VKSFDIADFVILQWTKIVERRRNEKPLIKTLLTNWINLTLLEVGSGRLRTSRYFQFAWSWHCRDVSSTTPRKHCICLDFSCSWASIRAFNIAKVLRNSFCTTRTFCRRCTASWVTWWWCFIFTTWSRTCSLLI
jgi:hypothetical protein